MARQLSASRAANRRLAEECPDHHPICVGRLGKLPILHFRCESCEWGFSCSPDIATAEGLPVPPDVHVSTRDERDRNAILTFFRHGKPRESLERIYGKRAVAEALDGVTEGIAPKMKVGP